MSADLLLWLRVGHVFGLVLWIGLLFSAARLANAHARGETEASRVLADLHKGLGISLDIGATVTILFGVLLLVLPPGGLGIFRAGGFFHVKLLLVAGLIAIHVLVRIKQRALRSGQASPLPSWLPPGVLATTFVILTMILVRPF